ncbi:ABC transporter substrate-binding protein [Kibdelosporangium aridum]|uniref:Cellobiose transport system substrate-binding protein n=1 Tax=Kibdelosporangium aridum TaxID=2030 RepID=A0A1Y5XUA7_KIBAR|nr:extracellular solute-binding protein [Kibdelosporangium aridum]SMD17858.1 cellobiose transport system substrate-binding protein [Kibdelosporangium aridum]
MAVDRRGFLAGAGACLLALAGCTSPQTTSPGRLTLWYWTRGLSDKVLDEAKTRFADAKFNPANVGHNLRHRLLAAISGNAYIPDITMLNDDIAGYFEDADQFIDLNTLGADRLKDQYLPWKWQAGTTPDGKLLGFPIDTGPAALFYRHDLFAQAGFPSEPDDVARAVSTWDQYFDFSAEIQKALPGRYMITDAKTVFTYSMAQEPQKYLDRQHKYIGDQAHVQLAWDRALTAVRKGLTAGLVDTGSESGSVDRHAAWNNGKELSLVNASWITGEIKESAARTAGAWRICRSPGGAGNQGGSFMALTRYCADPQTAFEITSWILNPANQARHYVDAGLFPSAPAAFDDPLMREPDPFFGGQVTVDVFGQAAKEVKPAYFSPQDIDISNILTDELVNVESAGKDPGQAWRDAQNSVNRLLRRRGVL